MGAFVLIACPWLLIAIFMMWMQRRADDPTAGQWRSEPSNFFGGSSAESASSSAPPTSTPNSSGH